MKILLINPANRYDARLEMVSPYIPYGLLYIASFIEEEGHEVKVYDSNLKKRDISGELRKFQPDIVGLSVMTGPCISDAIILSKAVKSFDNNLPVVWGGVHPTILPEQTLKEDFIDFIIRGEGELTFLGLLGATKQGNFSKVSGLSFKKNGRQYHNPQRRKLIDMDKLPDPSWHLIDMKKYGMTINTSRGCPFDCSFCYNKRMYGKTWRGLGAERIIKQMTILNEKYGFDKINFLEDNFTFNKKRLTDFCGIFRDTGLEISWSCESRPGYLKSETYKEMKNSGCAWMGFGVESGSPRILKLISKGITVNQILKTFKACNENGIFADAYVMCNLPTETVGDFKLTLKLLEKIKFRFCDMMIYRPYPGTELYDFCIENGLFEKPERLEQWINISDVHSTEFSIGSLPKKVMDDAISKISKKNKWNQVLTESRDHFSLLLKQLKENPKLAYRIPKTSVWFASEIMRKYKRTFK